MKHPVPLSHPHVRAVQHLHFCHFPADVATWDQHQVRTACEVARKGEKRLDDPGPSICNTHAHHRAADKWKRAHETFVRALEAHPARSADVRPPSKTNQKARKP